MKYHIITSQELIWTMLLRRHIVVHLQEQPTNKQVWWCINEQFPARLCSIWLWNREERHIHLTTARLLHVWCQSSKEYCYLPTQRSTCNASYESYEVFPWNKLARREVTSIQCCSQWNIIHFWLAILINLRFQGFDGQASQSASAMEHQKYLHWQVSQHIRRTVPSHKLVDVST